MIFRDSFEVQTKILNYANITKEIQQIVEKSKIKEGICHLFLPATTAGIMVNEMDHFLIEDFKRFFREIASEERMYAHTDNAHSHIRAAMLSQSISFPVSRGKIMLGAWQSILLWEFDIKDRKRKIIITITGI
mgnify:CR=1 FL=1